jgi:uncharacterized SAM-binding protein YcdF (DUF218 family)
MIILRLLRAVVLFFGFCSLFWLTGLVVFAEHVAGLDAAAIDTDPAPVDAIVVLTGGSERVRNGIELLKAGKGKKLFISGVYPGLTLEHILNMMDVDETMRKCCIVLGHAAGSTEGNAEETQNWLSLENYHSVRLVTANYHMPRSLLLFHTLLPDITITPHPIAPESVILKEWWLHAGTAGLLVTEYNKYLFARFGVWAGVVL